jgi:hypothetical protein
MRQFCGTADGRRDGEPLTDGWTFEDLRTQMGVISQMNAALDGKGYPDDVTDLEMQMLDAYRDEERKLQLRWMNRPESK